uniref:Uncharacterized protein n=1 Tax=Rhizophora mucronata TaxID=61149 RepID=A0A2P2NAZ5_RHIMU
MLISHLFQCNSMPFSVASSFLFFHCQDAALSKEAILRSHFHPTTDRLS